MKYLIFIIFFLFFFNIQAYRKGIIRINNIYLNIDIAYTEQEKSTGLMYKHNIPDNYGMLFVFDKPDYYAFWMKNTYIPLDIVFIDCNRNIVSIEKGTPMNETPIYPPKPICFVLETKYGFFKRHNIIVGQKIYIK